MNLPPTLSSPEQPSAAGKGRAITAIEGEISSCVKMAERHTASVTSAFDKYQPFVTEVRNLTSMQVLGDWHDKALAALNGQAGTELEKRVSLYSRRRAGAFFTNHVLADKLLSKIDFGANPTIYDMACGAGDLLLAAARIIGKKDSLKDTLQCWQRFIHGTDRVGHFVDAARERLLLQARVLHPKDRIPQKEAFENVSVGDAMTEEGLIAKATHIVMNPPFVSRKVAADCEWASGKANQAATFVAHSLRHMRVGAQMYAILPEVLRTGTRYRKWRELVAASAQAFTVESAGQFSATADVDVFFLRLTRGKGADAQQSAWDEKPVQASASVSLEDHFEVSVGPVVPYRDPHEGDVHPFATPQNIAAWKVISEATIPKRRWKGRLIRPPFVVLRRTSRPGDQYRATASIVSGRQPVAVENHLIVCSPKDGGMRACLDLKNALRAEEVNTHLNKIMRCRHLTVKSVREIPLVANFRKPTR